MQGRPLVVLSRRLGADFVVRLIGLGIADVIELEGEPADIAVRVFAHASHAGALADAADLIGESPALRRLREGVRSAIQVCSTVLIQGETGTGKGVVARRIHAAGKRKDRPFVHVDCAALAPTLIESELFGHERGAFTGAAAQHRGKLESAEDGTIFLDEIGELALHLQPKLLRVLEERSFERVGGTSPLRLYARVIAATNRPLAERVRAGTFRSDLYYRLNVLALEVPPLRERREDVPALVQLALERACEQNGIVRPRVSDAAYSALMQYDWPGNVRELMNLVERLAVARRSAFSDPTELADLLNARDHRPKAKDPSQLSEAEIIADALREAGGNVSRVCRRLELPRGTLRYRIIKYGLLHLIQRD